MSWSNYLELEILDHIFKGNAYTRPTHLYVGLSTADPTEDASGLAEPSGNGYARVEFDDWTVAASGATHNDSDVQFPTATGSWGTVTHFAIFDASTSGNMLGSAALGSSKSITTDDAPKFAASALIATLD